MSDTSVDGARPMEPSGRPIADATWLIVDDSRSDQRLIMETLVEAGAARGSITCVGSLAEAMRALSVDPVDCILLDLGLPDAVSFEGVAAMAAAAPDTPIVVVTGRPDDAVAYAVMAEGADEYLSKSELDPSRLGDVTQRSIHRRLGAERNRRGTLAPTGVLESVTAAAATLDEAVPTSVYLRADLLAARAREVQAQADQLRLLTDAAPIGIFQLDDAGRYVHTNPRWSEITGIEGEQAVGLRWEAILSPDQRATRLHAVRRDRATATELELRFEVRHRDSAPRIVHAAARRVPDTGGGSAGWVGTLSDVTAEARAEQAMSAARDAALSASVMQRNFTASASHELRTPTSSILGYVEEVLESDDLTVADRGFLEIAHRNAKRLAHLIDDLLILGEAEVGPSMMHMEDVALGPLVADIVASFAATAQRGRTGLVLEQDDVGSSVRVDPVRFEQALGNLISNALKFTGEDGTVSVRVVPDGAAVRVSVEDTGMGIDPADIVHIFERFYRSKVAIDTATKGTGLGLTIAKRMVEAQDGTLSVSSALGAGSTFTITLPRSASVAADA